MESDARFKPNRWILVAFAIVILAAAAVTIVDGLRLRRRTSVPEPVAPVTLVEAYGLMDGGTKVVRLCDAAGNKFEFCLTHFDDPGNESCDTNNRLFVYALPPQGRAIELRSAEEQRLRRALVLAIENQREHPDPTAQKLGDEERNVAYAKAALARFKSLGEPLPP